MALDIKWTKTAADNFDKTAHYLLHHWDKQTTKKFIAKVDKTLRLITRHPNIGKQEPHAKNIRGFLLSSQTTIFYRLEKQEIIILT